MIITNTFISSSQYNKLKSELEEHIKNLDEIDLTIKGNLEGNISNLFMPDNSEGYSKYNLKNLDMSDLKVAEVTNMSHLLDGGSQLLTANLANWKISNSAINMGYLFKDCHNLTSVDLSNFNIEDITDVSYMFANCYNLINIDISVLNLANIRTSSCIFNNCHNLENIKLPNNWYNIGYLAFHNCNKIMEFDFSNYTQIPKLDQVSAFDSTNRDSKIIVPDNLYEEWKISNNWNYYENRIVSINNKEVI